VVADPQAAAEQHADRQAGDDGEDRDDDRDGPDVGHRAERQLQPDQHDGDRQQPPGGERQPGLHGLGQLREVAEQQAEDDRVGHVGHVGGDHPAQHHGDRAEGGGQRQPGQESSRTALAQGRGRPARAH
jgi:hypothetical protein